MAIFWNYIKGTEGDWVETTKDGTSINHKGGTTLTKIVFNKDARPTILVGTTDYGSIITTDGQKEEVQTINTNLKITNLTANKIKTSFLNTEGDIIANKATLGDIKSFNFHQGVNLFFVNAPEDNIVNTFTANTITTDKEIKISSLKEFTQITPNEIKIGVTNNVSTGTLTVSKIIFQ